MELNKSYSPATTGYRGSGVFAVPHGKSLKIETSPQGEDILNECVPNNKNWTVTIDIRVVEIDR